MHNLVGNDVGGILRHTQNGRQAKSVFETLRDAQISGENSGMDTNKGNAAVGGEIRRRRKALGMTLEELAFQIGGDNGNLSRLERGKQGYSDEMLRKIAQALGCSVADLISDEIRADSEKLTQLLKIE